MDTINMRAMLFFSVLNIIVYYCYDVEGLEVQVDENGFTHDQGGKDSYGGYHFGSTSMESLELKPWSVLKDLFPNASQSLADAWEKRPLRFSHHPRRPKLKIHGRDYFILKYIIRDGEEWNGQLPGEKVPLQSIPLLLQQKSFSLVINNMQRRWKPIKDFARSLEMEINPHAVVCNLYLTPPRSSRAFESHIDWMDVIVLQLMGEKEWSVWDTPFVKLVPPDQKRKPTAEELRKEPFKNVRMKPGDVLYIPRGNLHNATTPRDSTEMSLHLTFGIQYDFYATLESLLHHAVVMFRAENKTAGSIAVRSRLCGGKSLTFDKLLHFSISEIVRRTNCGGFGEAGVIRRMNKSGNDQDEILICNLRKSVPLHPEWKKLTGRSDDDIEEQYVRGLEAILQQISVKNTLNFVNIISQGEGGVPTLGSNAFTYVGMKNFEKYQCKLEKDEITDLQKDLGKFAASFADFAKKTFNESMQNLLRKIENDRLNRWRREDALLDQQFGSDKS